MPDQAELQRKPAASVIPDHGTGATAGPRAAKLERLGAALNARSAAAMRGRSGAKSSDGAIAQRKEAVRGGLPEGLRQGAEALSGIALDDVRVHRNSAAPAKLGAHAYAQGRDIHLAPGQDRHLPHEAWHVVQQRQGRVRTTAQLATGMPINDDAGLEHEADVMGARALQRVADDDGMVPSAGTVADAAPVQRRTAEQAGLPVGGQVAANAALYNIPGGVVLPNGILYGRALPQADDTAAVLATYIADARPVGQAVHLAGTSFLDRNQNPQAPPGNNNWGVGGAAYLTALETFAQAAPGAFAGLDRAAAVVLYTSLTKAGRAAARGDARIGLIDPFVTRATIPHAGAHPWVIDTNYSDSALGYITRIHAGSVNLTGEIAASPAVFAGVQNAQPAPDAVYSPAHDIDPAHDIGTQIAGLDAAGTNLANHPGFDAVAKLGAEGARFEPVRQMGLALKVNSRFLAIDGHGVARYLDFRDLYANWGTWFGRHYGVDAATVRAQVLLRGNVLAGAADLAHDFDLDEGVPVSAAAVGITAFIRNRLDRIVELKRQKTTYARRGRNQQAIAAYNRGRNREIADQQALLAPYRRVYPTLYHAALPPPVVVAPPVDGGGGGGA